MFHVERRCDEADGQVLVSFCVTARGGRAIETASLLRVWMTVVVREYVRVRVPAGDLSES